MNLDAAIVELSPADFDPDTFEPSEPLLEALHARVARCGSTAVPGFVIIPETAHLIRRRERFNRFIDTVLGRLLEVWRARDDDAISPIPYLYASGRRVDNYYKAAPLLVNPTRLIGRPQTSFFLHTDFLRIQYSAISYGCFRNVTGGTLRIYDALRLHEERGVGLMDLVTVKVPTKKARTLNDRQFYFVARMDILERNPEFMMHFRVPPRRMPLVIVSNKFLQDGILHGPTRVRRRDTSRPMRRPSYLGSIAADYLTDVQLYAL